MDLLPGTTQATYAELVEELRAIDAHRSIGHAPGTFVKKTIKGRTYVYFQFSEPGGAARQAYVGAESPETDGLVRRFTEERTAARSDRAQVEALSAALRAGGAGTTDAASARVIAALAESGVFHLGAVLVGTQAFVVLGNVLGVRWTGASARTEDVDLAASRVLEIAVPELRADVPATLESLGMGFLPVPAFSHDDPSTSFKVRGKGLRVDLVTTATKGGTRPVPIPRLRAAAAPLRYLELLLEEPSVPAAVIDGGGILVNVPHPARFAIHKLLVAQDRPVAMQTKSKKDVHQAALVIEALDELRPGDLRAAWLAAGAQGKSWKAALKRGATLLERLHPDTHARIAPLARALR